MVSQHKDVPLLLASSNRLVFCLIARVNAGGGATVNNLGATSEMAKARSVAQVPMHAFFHAICVTISRRPAKRVTFLNCLNQGLRLYYPRSLVESITNRHR